MSKLPHQLNTDPARQDGESVRRRPEQLKHNIEFKDAASDGRTRKLIESLITRIDNATRIFPSDARFLQVLVDEDPVHHLWKVSLTLELPGKTLAANNEGPELEASLRSAFAEVERQLAALRREHLWQQLATRHEVRKSDAPVSDEKKRESFFGLISPHLDELGGFVKREIDYAEAMGDLVRGELNVQDVVDAALVKAYQEYAQKPIQEDVRSWLIALAIEQVEPAIRRSRWERTRTVHVEEDIPETPPAEEVSRMGEDMFYFYQPDEDLKVEDVIPDIKIPTPEQELETNELRQCVRAALSTLSREQRRLLILRYIQGLSVRQLAKATGKAEPEVERILEESRQYLRARLMEANCGL
jgi:RNA polymerase sigma factor (sigma-70 family)